MKATFGKTHGLNRHEDRLFRTMTITDGPLIWMGCASIHKVNDRGNFCHVM